MPESGAAPARAELRRRLRLLLGEREPGLRLFAEDLLGEDDLPIDWVGMERDGRAWVGLLACGPAEAGLLELGLAQRVWIAARLADWLKLTPGLEIDPYRRPRLLLVASEFSRTLRVAAREADPEGIRLARYFWEERAGVVQLHLELLEPAGRLAAVALGARPPEAPLPFRSGLSEPVFSPRDRELTPAERDELLARPSQIRSTAG